jgi:hypothetical protein
MTATSEGAPILFYVWDEGDYVLCSPAEVGTADEHADQGDRCLACELPFVPWDVVIVTDGATEGEFVSHLACQVVNPQVTLTHMTDHEACRLMDTPPARHVA